MKSLIVTAENELEIKEVPKPIYNTKQALVKVISCGICGTDLTLIQKSFKGIPKKSYPIMLGHEAIGRVEEVGSEVNSFKKGDIVFLPFNDAKKLETVTLESAWGGFSEYGVVDDNNSYKFVEAPEASFAQQIVPSDIDPIDAAMIVTLREVYSALKHFNIKSKETIVVFGSGTVATTFIKLLKLIGVKTIIGVARSEEKSQILKKSGAAYVINSNIENIYEKLNQIQPHGVDRVLDAVGSSEIINQGLSLIKDRGEILCYGVPNKNNMNLDWSNAPYNWKLNFQQMPYKQEEGEATDTILKWVRSGDIDLKEYISDYFHFDNVIDAFKKVQNKRVLKKAIITFE